MLAIQLTRSKGAPGEDCITKKILKRLSRPYLEIFTKIFNASLKLHHVPARWKVVTVIMLPKPLKDPTKPDSYRPISLLNTPSKLLERIISFRLTKFTNENQSLSVYQCGFRRHHQINDRILRVTQAVKSAFNREQIVGACLVDIKGASTASGIVAYSISSTSLASLIFSDCRFKTIYATGNSKSEWMTTSHQLVLSKPAFPKAAYSAQSSSTSSSTTSPKLNVLNLVYSLTT